MSLATLHFGLTHPIAVDFILNAKKHCDWFREIDQDALLHKVHRSLPDYEQNKQENTHLFRNRRNSQNIIQCRAD